MKIAWIIGNLLAFGGLVTSIYYLLATRGPETASTSFDPAIFNLISRIKKRRRFGAVLMAFIAVLFIVAVNGFVDNRTPTMILFWFFLLIMLLWLLILGMLDMLSVNRLKRQIESQAGDRLRRFMKKNPFPTKIKHDDKDKK